MHDQPSSRAYVDAAKHALGLLAERTDVVDRIAGVLIDVLRSGGKVMTCGNGGSAAEAMHLAEEMVGRYRRNRRPLAALSLNADPTAMTCIANDWDYDETFARQLEGLGRPGDVLVVLSTSGRSPSILRALERARGHDVRTIGLLGPVGSPAEALCDASLTLNEPLPSSHVQEIHIVVIHTVLEQLDQAFAAEG